MKRVCRKIIALVIVMAIALSGANFVNAEDSGVKIGLSSSSSKLEAGQTVTVNVNFNQSVEGGIGSMMGKLTYDSNVLEYVDAKGEADWQAVYVASTGILGIERNNNTSTTGKIATITFKVKDPLSVSSTKISYNITDVGLDDPVNIAAVVTIGTETASNGTENNDQSKTESTSEASTPKTITQSQSKSSKLPYAGDLATGIILTSVVAVVIVAIVGFVKYTKNKDI